MCILSFSGLQPAVSRQGRFKYLTSKDFRRNGHYDMLLRELEINSLLPLFVTSHVLTNQEEKVIKQQKHRRRRVGAFLDLLFKRRTEEWIDTVLLILDENQHSHVVRQLQGLREPFQQNRKSDFHNRICTIMIS